MVYRFQLKQNLKSLLLPGIALVLLAASVAIMAFYHVVLGIVALAVTAFISYHIVRFFINTLKSHVRTSDDGMVCATALGSETTVSWDALTHAGWYTTDSGYRELYVYAEGDDQLLTIPPQYENMETLEEEILDRSGLEPLSLAGEEVDGLTDALRAHIVPESEIIDDEADEE
ncbi:MAG: hypothetical protein ACOCZB_05020 [Spirochaetota bacterium]